MQEYLDIIVHAPEKLLFDISYNEMNKQIKKLNEPL